MKPAVLKSISTLIVDRTQFKQERRVFAYLHCPILRILAARIRNIGQKSVPHKWFESAYCDTIYLSDLYRCTNTSHPNPFRGAHCIVI